MKTFLLKLSYDYVYFIDIYCNHKGISRTEFFREIVHLRITTNKEIIKNIGTNIKKNFLNNNLLK